MNTLIAKDIACTRQLSTIFDHLSFSLCSGECLLLLGVNGSGKTSLLRLIAGLLHLSGGTLTYNDHPLTQDAYQSKILFLSQDLPLKPVLSVRENLDFLSAALGVDITPDAIDKVGLSRLFDYPVRYLSSGQKRRVMMAPLTASGAEIILLDEPTTHLDSDGIALLQSLIENAQTRGAIVVIATHTPEHFTNPKILTIGAPHIAKAAG